MYQISSPMPQGIGAPCPLPRISQTHDDFVSALIDCAGGGGGSCCGSVADIRPNERAQNQAAGRPQIHDPAPQACDRSGTDTIEHLVRAAGQADVYLSSNPSLAAMPLGQVVARLVDAAAALAEGKPVDGELERLAKRVGQYVHDHPRLADSEFGQIVMQLARCFLASEPHAATAETVEAREAEVTLRAASPKTAVTLRAA